MSAEAHISDTRHGHILAELAGLGLTLARDLQARALAAETSEEAARLATAFHRISRGVRQSLALEARLGREAEAHALQTAPLRETERVARVNRRRSQVFQAVQRLIWNETEDNEIAGCLVDDLREMLDFEALEDDFLAEPLDRQIDRIRLRFELSGGEAGPDAPPGDFLRPDHDPPKGDAPADDPPAVEAWPGSPGARIAGLAAAATGRLNDTS